MRAGGRAGGQRIGSGRGNARESTGCGCDGGGPPSHFPPGHAGSEPQVRCHLVLRARGIPPTFGDAKAIWPPPGEPGRRPRPAGPPGAHRCQASLRSRYGNADVRSACGPQAREQRSAVPLRRRSGSDLGPPGGNAWISSDTGSRSWNGRDHSATHRGLVGLRDPRSGTE